MNGMRENQGFPMNYKSLQIHIFPHYSFRDSENPGICNGGLIGAFSWSLRAPEADHPSSPENGRIRRSRAEFLKKGLGTGMYCNHFSGYRLRQDLPDSAIYTAPEKIIVNEDVPARCPHSILVAVEPGIKILSTSTFEKYSIERC